MNEKRAPQWTNIIGLRSLFSCYLQVFKTMAIGKIRFPFFKIDFVEE
jgi:hypothetical protein